MKTILFLLVISIVLIPELASTATYHLAKTGNDNNSGLSWEAAWQTIDKVNQALPGGDTLFIGTGIWRGKRLDVTSGSRGAPTVYACSTFASTNGNDEYHFAKIYASTQVTVWSSIGGGVYTHPASVIGPLFEDQMMLLKSSSPLLGQGEWWTNVKHVFGSWGIRIH